MIHTIMLTALFLGLLCIIWMNYQTKKHQVKDRLVWMILAVVIPVPAVLIFYFTQMRNKTNEI